MSNEKMWTQQLLFAFGPETPIQHGYDNICDIRVILKVSQKLMFW